MATRDIMSFQLSFFFQSQKIGVGTGQKGEKFKMEQGNTCVKFRLENFIQKTKLCSIWQVGGSARRSGENNCSEFCRTRLYALIRVWQMEETHITGEANAAIISDAHPLSFNPFYFLVILFLSSAISVLIWLSFPFAIPNLVSKR
jgi:hypothetical protein